ncbi:MAG: DUF4885 domain-containing protein [Synergistaceae bacterium]|nr:DUF4885 domain-containing protein [Synergistaceae bacterium]
MINSIYKNPYSGSMNGFSDRSNAALSQRQAKIYYSMKLIDCLNGNRSHSKDTVNISEQANQLLANQESAVEIQHIDLSTLGGRLTNLNRYIQGIITNGTDYWDDTDFKTGYPWIDNITLKRDSEGPLTPYEQRMLNGLRYGLAQQQADVEIQADYYGCDRFKNWRPDLNLSLDADGYLRNMSLDAARNTVERRDEINAAIESQLAAQGITLTSKDKFSIIVNFNNTITINGHADEAQGKEIERALNNLGPDFAYKLRQTIFDGMNQTMQYTCEESMKYTVNYWVEKYTGYSINQLTVQDNDIFTDDGQKFTDLLRNAVAKDYPDDPEYSEHIGMHTGSLINQIKYAGIKNARDTSSAIEYRSNSLCDVNTTLGYGVDQRGWYDKLLSLRGDIEKLHSYLYKIDLNKPLSGWVHPILTY